MSTDRAGMAHRQMEELQTLIAGLCEGELSREETARLEELICADEACCEYYVKAMHVDAALPRYVGAAVRSAAAIVAEWQAREASTHDAVLRVWTQCQPADAGLEDLSIENHSTEQQTKWAAPTTRPSSGLAIPDERRQSRAAAAASSVQNGWSHGATTQTRLESSCGALRLPWLAKLGAVAGHWFSTASVAIVATTFVVGAVLAVVTMIGVQALFAQQTGAPQDTVMLEGPAQWRIRIVDSHEQPLGTFVPSDKDLLQTALVAIHPPIGTAGMFDRQRVEHLVNGRLYNPADSDRDRLNATPDSYSAPEGTVVDFELDTTVSPGGYDLNRIETYTTYLYYRTGHNYQIYVRFVDQAEFESRPLVTVLKDASHRSGNWERKVTIDCPPDGLPMASGVSAIRFEFLGNRNKNIDDVNIEIDVYREIDVFGVPTATPSMPPPT